MEQILTPSEIATAGAAITLAMSFRFVTESLAHAALGGILGGLIEFRGWFPRWVFPAFLIAIALKELTFDLPAGKWGAGPIADSLFDLVSYVLGRAFVIWVPMKGLQA